MHKNTDFCCENKINCINNCPKPSNNKKNEEIRPFIVEKFKRDIASGKYKFDIDKAIDALKKALKDIDNE